MEIILDAKVIAVLLLVGYLYEKFRNYQLTRALIQTNEESISTLQNVLRAIERTNEQIAAVQSRIVDKIIMSR